MANAYESETTDRSVRVKDVNEEQYYGTIEAMGFPRNWFGRFKSSDRTDMHLDVDQVGIHGLERLIRFAKQQKLVFEETTTRAYTPRA